MSCRFRSGTTATWSHESPRPSRCSRAIDEAPLYRLNPFPGPHSLFVQGPRLVQRRGKFDHPGASHIPPNVLRASSDCSLTRTPERRHDRRSNPRASNLSRQQAQAPVSGGDGFVSRSNFSDRRGLTSHDVKVLITGGAGYIGSITAKALAAAGHVTVVLDDLSAGPKAFVQDRVFYRGDVADRELIRRIVREHPDLDCTVHMAAKIVVPESITRAPTFTTTRMSRSHSSCLTS